MTLSVSTSTRRRALAALLAAGLAATACSEQEGAAPQSAPPTVATTTTVPPTTIPPATTTTTTTEPPPTTTTTTVAPTTTAAPVPTGDPTNVSSPVFAGSSDDAWLYLGRWTGSAWEGAFDETGAPIPAEIAPGTAVSIAELGQTPVAGTADGSGEACFDEGTGAINGPIISPNAGVPDTPGFGYRAIATPGTWNIRPREAIQIDETIQAYADAGVAAFADDPVETQAGEIDQTVVADLDGDGDTEVLVVFGHENERVEDQSEPTAGFSALLLLEADSRSGTTVAKSFTPEVAEGEPVPVFDTFRVLDVVDLNGDGISEVVTHRWFVGGASVSVYSYDGATLTEVLGAGCGT